MKDLERTSKIQRKKYQTFYSHPKKQEKESLVIDCSINLIHPFSKVNKRSMS